MPNSFTYNVGSMDAMVTTSSKKSAPKKVIDGFSAIDAKKRTELQQLALKKQKMSDIYQQIDNAINNGLFSTILYKSDPSIKTHPDSNYWYEEPSRNISISRDILDTLKEAGYTVTEKFQDMGTHNDTRQPIQQLVGYTVSWE